MRTAVATGAAGTLIALAGCGSSSKPAYCTDRTNLENSVKNLPSVTSSSGVSGLKSQLNTIVSDANSVVSSAKSDFPSQTSAVKTSVDALQTAVKALPASPSASQIAVIGLDVQNVVSSVQSFTTPASRSAADTSVRHGGRGVSRLVAWHPCPSVGAARPVGRARGDHERGQDRGKAVR